MAPLYLREKRFSRDKINLKSYKIQPFYGGKASASSLMQRYSYNCTFILLSILCVL